MVEKNKILLLRPQAQKDLDAIAKQSPQIFKEILSKIEFLLEFPEMGPRMELAYQGYRQILCGNYRVIYEITSSQQIEVAYIRHCARQLGLRIIESN